MSKHKKNHNPLRRISYLVYDFDKVSKTSLEVELVTIL